MAQTIPALAQVSIVGYRLVPPDQLLANPSNPRRHPNAQREALRASLRALGWIAPVVQNVRTGHLIDGHARVEEALSAGVVAVPVIDVDLSPEQEALALATFDPITAMAALDRDALDSLLRDVSTDETALQALLADVAQSAGLEYDPGDGPGSDGAAPFADFAPVVPSDEYVAFRFGDYGGQVARAVYDTFLVHYRQRQSECGAVMLDDVLREWLGV